MSEQHHISPFTLAQSIFPWENNQYAEVGRVPKNSTQVKVLIEIFTQVKVKVIVWNSYLSKSKKVLDEKNYSSS